MPDVPHYPAEADMRIREAAEYANFPDAVQILDMIKNELLGDPERVERLADAWGQNTTMDDVKEDINHTRDELASYWRGPAFNAFDRFSANVAGVMQNDLTVMSSISTTLGQAITTVYDTYAMAIDYILSCVKEIGSLGLWLYIAGVTAPIPGVDILTAEAAIDKIQQVLDAFATKVIELITESTKKIGQYQSQGKSFVSLGNQFQRPEQLPSSANQTGEWQVNPNR